NGIRKIKSIYIEIGGMTHIDPSQFRFCFKFLSKGTVGEGCRLYIKKVKPKFMCINCKRRIEIDVKNLGEFDFKCPHCGGELIVKKGRELTLKRIKA
ncbi:MAG: hydrogenase/urease maturation nickel metallochaperone HypA, partial [Candidatus Methanomethyliaceae archaeon]|nr:hydrogenase/urease maturation nickel metallochaperone HypA [Candidatus Methanomethyliaceae archaeon]